MNKNFTQMISDLPILLGVNIDHVATVRNARGTHYPDPLYFAKIASSAGADIITLHLREDRRHIKDYDLKIIQDYFQNSKTRINLECSVNMQMIDIACQIAPTDVCLVPEKREELTTEGGLDVVRFQKEVSCACRQLDSRGIQVSLFIDPSVEQIDSVLNLGVKTIELHTGRYADAKNLTVRDTEFLRIEQAAQYAHEKGLNVNAGHGLHFTNVQPIAALKEIRELNIGHALVSYALLVGFDTAVRDMKTVIFSARQGIKSPILAKDFF